MSSYPGQRRRLVVPDYRPPVGPDLAGAEGFDWMELPRAAPPGEGFRNAAAAVTGRALNPDGGDDDESAEGGGVRRYPMDERLPDGSSMQEVIEEAAGVPWYGRTATPRLHRPSYQPDMMMRTGADDPLLREETPAPAPLRLRRAGSPPADEEPAAAPAPEAAAPPARRPLPTAESLFATPPEKQPAPADDPLTAPLAPVPPEALARIRRAVRPQMGETGDERADLARYDSDLQRWRDPADTNGRGRSALATGGARARDVIRAGGNPWQAIGALIAGGIHGLVSPNADERDWRDTEQARVASRRSDLDKRQAADLQLGVLRSKMGEPARQQAKAEADRVVRVYNDLPEFDPEAQDAESRELVERARLLGIPLPKKTRTERFSIQVTPDGRVFRVNTATGDIVEGKDPKTGESYNVSKPAAVKPEDLPDSLFGLPDERAMADEARAAVAPDLKSRRVTDYAQRHYQTPEGKFDEERAWRDVEDGVVRPSEIWENVTSQDDQRLAGARNKVRQKYQEQRREADRFRLRVSRARNKPDAETKPLADFVELFNEYSRIKNPKKRREMLDALYQALDYVNVQ